MRPLLFFVLIFSSLAPLRAQRADSLLLGSWLLTDGLPLTSTQYGAYEVLSLYDDHTFQKRYMRRHDYTKKELRESYFLSGSWRLDGDSLDFYNVKGFYPRVDTLRPVPGYSEIISRTGSDSLVFYYPGWSSGARNYYGYYERVPVLRRRDEIPGDTNTYLWTPPAHLADFYVMPVNRGVPLLLVNAAKPSRRRKFPAGERFELSLVENVRDSKSWRRITYDAEATQVTDSTLELRVRDKNVYYHTPDSSLTVHYSFPDSMPTVTLNLDRIDRIDFPDRDNVTPGIAAFFMINGAFVSTVVAPIVSMNYRTGEFNKERFTKWALAGTLSFGVGIPFLFFTKDHSYNIQNGTQEVPVNDQWRIRPEKNE